MELLITFGIKVADYSALPALFVSSGLLIYLAAARAAQGRR